MSKIHWGAASGGAIAAEIGQIAAAFAWVAVYSFVIHPNEPAEFYQAYAQVASPWVSIVAGAPVFYAAARWIGKSLPTALAIFAIFLLIDVTLLVIAGGPFAALAWLQIALSFTTKLLACWLGGKHGAITRAA